MAYQYPKFMLMRLVINTIVFAVMWYAIGYLINPERVQTDPNYWLKSLLAAALYALVYAGVHYYLWQKSLQSDRHH